MLWFLKKKKDDPVLKSMDGREIKYVTRIGTDENGNPTSVIMGKRGRIVCIDGEIRVLCGETDVFRCMAKDAEYYLHLSGDGVTVKGHNTVTGDYDHIMIFYTYYRK
jgi:hypothetical protein